MSWDESERPDGEAAEDAPEEPPTEAPAEGDTPAEALDAPAEPEAAAAAESDEPPAAEEQEAGEETAPEEPEAAEEAAPAPPEPEGAEQPETEPQPEREVAERAAAGEQAEGAERGKGAKDSKKGEKEVVPGADLDPIAITEERELTAEERARLEAEEEERRRREAAATDEDDEQPAPQRKVAVPGDALIQATGKRKTSVARVIVRSGEGKIEINDRELEQFFPRPHHQSIARQPLIATGYDGTVDVRVRVHGGGVSGQAGAVRHGIARALVELDGDLRGELKRRGMLTRDAREKERRKAGLKKARKRPQFSKR